MPNTTETIFVKASRQLDPVLIDIKAAVDTSRDPVEKKRLTSVYRKFLDGLNAFGIKRK